MKRHYIRFMQEIVLDGDVSSRKSPTPRQFWHPNKGSFIFKHLCKYCIVLDTKVLLNCVNMVLFSTQRFFCFQASVQILYCSWHTEKWFKKPESTNQLFFCLLIYVQICDVRKLIQQHLHSRLSSPDMPSSSTWNFLLVFKFWLWN